jgi:Flp pilus assembly pilin Flp
MLRTLKFLRLTRARGYHGSSSDVNPAIAQPVSLTERSRKHPGSARRHAERRPNFPQRGYSTVTFVDLLSFLGTRYAREDGQTMAEYGVVLAVIALACVVAFTALSGGIANAINSVRAVLP